jgi:DNA invertase Pin-like site-specific DNA recombinase
MMARPLTLGILVLSLSAGGIPSLAQAQGPSRNEVPTELWQKYPLKGPPAAAHVQRAQRQVRHGRAVRSASRARINGRNYTTAVLLGGLLVLTASVVFVLGARRSIPERLRGHQPAPRVKPAGAPPSRAGPRVQTGATASSRFRRSLQPDARGSPDHAQGLAGAPSGPLGPALTESAVDRDVAAAGQAARTPELAAAPAAAEAMPSSHRAPAPDPSTQAALGTQPALGYACASGEGDADGALRLQQLEIQAVCSRKGLTLVKLVRDVARGGPDLGRPGLGFVLERLAEHEASCIVVSSLERLTRSAANLGTLVEWLDRCGARLVVADIDLDTGTPEGRLGAKALAAVGGSERKTLRQRTRKGLEAARVAQRSRGQPAVSDRPALKRRIAEMRASGMTLQAIADTLNAEGVPTVRGGIEWRPSSVQAAVGYKRPNRKSRLG